MNCLLTVSLRQKADFIPASAIVSTPRGLTETTSILIAGLSRCGYSVSESLLYALNQTTDSYHGALLHTVQEVLGLQKYWTPLVKGWDTPTGESLTDHLATFFANLFHTRGTKLACGHIIPPKLLID